MLKIKAGTPSCLGVHDASDSSLADAMQTVFPLESKALIEWRGIVFELSYKYDIAFMVDDVVRWVLLMQERESGAVDIEWPASGFPYNWQIRWNSSDVEIDARARPEPGAEALTGRESVRVEKRLLLRDLRELLAAVLSCLRSSGYSSGSVAGLDRLVAATVEAG